MARKSRDYGFIMFSKTAVPLSLLLLMPVAPVLVVSAQAQTQNLTLTGTIVGHRDANEIWLRSYDRYYRVAGQAPFALKNGDRIRVYGPWKDGVLSGASWKMVEPLPTDFAPNRSISGEVYRELPGDEFQVKSYGGAIYRVLALKDKPKTLGRPDLVRVLGHVRDGVLLASKIIITSERTTLAPAPSYQPHQTVVGTVVSNSKGNAFEISSDGRRERVISLYNEDAELSIGHRVRIWAFWDGEKGLWQASNLRILSGETPKAGEKPGVGKAYGPQYRPSVIYGTVTALDGAKMTIRSNNANLYPVQLLVARPALVGVGSKVRVNGYWSKGTMQITAITDWSG